MTSEQQPQPESQPAEPFSGISDLHRRLGHPVRVAASRHQAYCVVCMVLWTSTDGSWYSTDLVEGLAA